jgi:hypothetical protein
LLAHLSQNEHKLSRNEKYTNIMSTKIRPPIDAFFQASNTRQTNNFLSLFTSEALVNDEANDYRGAAIKEWIDRATAEAKPIAEVTDLAHEGEKIVVTAQVTGNFPGSPIQLRYYFTLKDDKIARLTIKP